jgi:hypothetical protein
MPLKSYDHFSHFTKKKKEEEEEEEGQMSLIEGIERRITW